MNRLAIKLLSALAAAAVVASPVAQASIVSDFKADLAKTIGSKTKTAAAKAANKVTAKYVFAAPKGDPKKLKKFTVLAIKALKGLLDNKSTVDYVSGWGNKVATSYFKKGKIKYSVNNSQFKAAFLQVNKLLKGLTQTDINKAFQKGIKVTNTKMKGTSADLAQLQSQVAKADGGIVPAS